MEYLSLQVKESLNVSSQYDPFSRSNNIPIEFLHFFPSLFACIEHVQVMREVPVQKNVWV